MGLEFQQINYGITHITIQLAWSSLSLWLLLWSLLLSFLPTLSFSVSLMRAPAGHPAFQAVFNQLEQSTVCKLCSPFSPSFSPFINLDVLVTVFPCGFYLGPLPRGSHQYRLIVLKREFDWCVCKMYRPGPQQSHPDWCELSIITPTNLSVEPPALQTLCLPRGLASWGQGFLLLRLIELPATAFIFSDSYLPQICF